MISNALPKFVCSTLPCDILVSWVVRHLFFRALRRSTGCLSWWDRSRRQRRGAWGTVGHLAAPRPSKPSAQSSLPWACPFAGWRSSCSFGENRQTALGLARSTPASPLLFTWLSWSLLRRCPSSSPVLWQHEILSLAPICRSPSLSLAYY